MVFAQELYVAGDPVEEGEQKAVVSGESEGWKKEDGITPGDSVADIERRIFVGDGEVEDTKLKDVVVFSIDDASVMSFKDPKVDC